MPANESGPRRSGSGNLNSGLGGNSGHDAGLARPATEVIDGYEEVGAAHPLHAHPGVQCGWLPARALHTPANADLSRLRFPRVVP